MPGLTLYDTLHFTSQWESKKLPQISATLGRYSWGGGEISAGEKFLLIDRIRFL